MKTDDLENHIKVVVQKHCPFNVKFAGIEKSWDNWLFLGMDKGRDKAIALHDGLYSGILEILLRKDLPFSPHISLGQFNQEGSSYSLKNPKAVASMKNCTNRRLKKLMKLD